MTFEVELKFPIPDPADMALRLLALGAIAGPAIEQRDVYWEHPSRDFRATHEAFRLRQSGDELYLTYKGPIVDTQAKVRHEIELPIGRSSGDLGPICEMLELLGFRQVLPVEKTRSPFQLLWKGLPLELSIDVVPEVGAYLEIEAIAEEDGRDAARDVILDLAGKLEMGPPERKSYLRLVTERREAKNSGEKSSSVHLAK